MSVAKQVRIVGAGLLGTSIGLALTKLGLEVSIESASPSSQALAIEYGAGRPASSNDNPTLVVVCVPPDITARIAAEKLAEFPNAVVTDVASIKASVVEELRTLGADVSRFVGSHPMAGREKGGAISGRADLFFGRPWVITPIAENSESSIHEVEELAKQLGAVAVKMPSVEHDHAVALVSHVPQVISSLLAARLIDGEDEEIALAGQGLRDTTRIAASDPKLWTQILSGNRKPVLGILKKFERDLNSLIEALENPSGSRALTAINATIDAGNRGVARIPGKHGSKAMSYEAVVVMIDDKPGSFANLLNAIGDAGINIEDLKLEHSPGAQIGLVELQVLPSSVEKLTNELTAKGWRIAG
jgi:prephenate dehydrogenase